MFYAGTYRVAEESNRMGLRLEGSPIASSTGGEMISEGVSLGAVQITASRAADYFVCGAADDRWVSEDCECDFRGFEQPGAASAAR